MPLYLFYTMVQKSQKWPKTQIKGGPALNDLTYSMCKKKTWGIKIKTFLVRSNSGQNLQ